MESRAVFKKTIYILGFYLLFLSTQAAGKPHFAALVMEYPSRNILYSENPTIQNQPASLTKVMTLYLVFQALENGTLTLDQSLHVSAHAANRQPSRLGLRPNSIITVEQAICGLVTKSANDAASVLAESLAPTEEEFGIRMTDQARKLGMSNTRFKNASGIADNQQTTTAMDMAILGSSIMRDYPNYYHYFSLKEFNYNNLVFKNHNHLLGKYMGCDGIKTGFTAASGFNLLSSATRNGHRLIAVVLGGNSIKSRDLRTMQLLDLGFSKIATANNNTPGQPSQFQAPQPTQALPPTGNSNPSTTSNVSLDLEKPNTTIEEEF